MKIFVLMCCCALVAISEAFDEKEGKEMVIQMAQECKEKEKASDEDVNRLADQKMPNTPEGKCLTACMQEQVGIIDENHQFSPEGFVEVSRMLTEDDKDKMKVAEEMAEECRPTASEDRCELSLKIMECIKVAAEKHGIKPKSR